jgi:hypothetical protein
MTVREIVTLRCIISEASSLESYHVSEAMKYSSKCELLRHIKVALTTSNACQMVTLNRREFRRKIAMLLNVDIASKQPS